MLDLTSRPARTLHTKHLTESYTNENTADLTTSPQGLDIYTGLISVTLYASFTTVMHWPEGQSPEKTTSPQTWFFSTLN